MKMKVTLLLAYLMLLGLNLQAQVSGVVFRDFNANGEKDNISTYNETFVKGITVTAYPTSGSSQTTTTDANGAYSFTGLTLPVRIEFSGYASFDYSAPIGTSNNSSVQFYSATTTTANFGINYPQHYTSSTNPYYIVAQFEANRPPASNSLATAMLKQQYSVRGNDDTNYAPSIAKTSEIGSTWGVVYDRKNSLIYTSTFVKRHASMIDNDGDGTEDIGAIYVMTTSGSPMLWKDLSTLGIDFGVSLMPSITTRSLPLTLTGPSHDELIYPLVGKIGIGGITISDDFSKLYVMNLYDKKIYTIDIATKTLLGSSTSVPNPCSAGVGNARPYGLKYHRGKVYVGVVCDAATSQNVNDLLATVYSYDGTSFSSVLSYPLNYAKGYAFKDIDGGIDPSKPEYGKSWYAWLDVMPPNSYTTTSTSHSSYLIHPQPMLVDMEFDVDESLIMIFNDRLGHQGGYNNYGTDVSDNTSLYLVLIGGDILRASYNGSSYTLESNGTAGSNTSAGAGNGEGPGGGEFYFGDHSTTEYNGNYHNEDVIGGSFFMPGTNQVAALTIDAVTYYAGGVYFFNNTTGDVIETADVDRYQLYQWTQDVTKYGKANGLGDIEMISDPAPIEIGNRIWLDSNGDGVQDPSEAPISGVTVQLLKSGSVIATATTDAQGRYVFSNDSTKPTGTNADAFRYNITQLTANMAYTVHFPTTATVSGTSYNLTTQNATTGAGVDDWIDSDASSTGDISILTTDLPTSGANNHTFDVGYRLATVSCSLTSVTATPTTCDVSTNEYEISGNISFTNAPTSGTLTVSISGGGSQVLSAPFTSPTAYNITGLDSDGVSHTVTAVFSADATCTGNTTYTAPEECYAPVDGCNTTSITAQAGACDVATNRYTLTGQITFASAPTSGTLIVRESGGGSVTLSAPFTNPLNFTINNLYADGLDHVVNMSLSTFGNCTNSAAYTAPDGCSNCFSTPCSRTTVIKN